MFHYHQRFRKSEERFRDSPKNRSISLLLSRLKNWKLYLWNCGMNSRISTRVQKNFKKCYVECFVFGMAWEYYVLNIKITSWNKGISGISTIINCISRISFFKRYAAFLESVYWHLEATQAKSICIICIAFDRDQTEV